MTQSECTRYRRPAEGHTELSTTMNSQRSSRADSSSGPRRRRVWLIEGGYTSDTRLVRSLQKETSAPQVDGCSDAQRLRCQAYDLCFWGWGFNLQAEYGRHAPTGGQHSRHHKDFERYPSAFCHLCNQHHYSTQNSGPAKTSTASPYATISALNPPPSQSSPLNEGWP